MGLDRLHLIYDECYICGTEYAIIKDDTNKYKLYTKIDNMLHGEFDSIVFSNVISILISCNDIYIASSRGDIIKPKSNTPVDIVYTIEKILNKEILNNMVSSKYLIKSRGLFYMDLKQSENRKHIDIEFRINKVNISQEVSIGKFNIETDSFDIKPSEMYMYTYNSGGIEILENSDKETIISLFDDKIIHNIKKFNIEFYSNMLLVIKYSTFNKEFIISIDRIAQNYKIKQLANKRILIKPYLAFEESTNAGILLEETGRLYKDKMIYRLYDIGTLILLKPSVIILGYTTAYKGLIELGILNGNDIDIIKYDRERMEINLG